jgi:hypothetical protein
VLLAYARIAYTRGDPGHAHEADACGR